ncbi:PAZ domain-containing protein, partial [Gymnopilus junonius]
MLSRWKSLMKRSFTMTVAIIPDRLPARLNMQLYGRLQAMVPAFKSAVYDTKKNIYSINPLPLGPNDAASFDVTLEQDGPPSGRPPKVYQFKVTKVAEINTELLHRFIAGQQTLDNPVFTAIMAFNVVIRMRPNEKHPFNVRSFFVPQGKRPIGNGIELWHGYFQSVRPSQNKMYINLDIATGVMYKDGRLIDLCLEFFGRPNPNPNMLSPQRGFPDRERHRLQRFLTGVRVITKHGGRTRAHVIKKVTTEGANARMFTTREGQTLSVANYFRTTLGKALQFPDIVCVEVGSGAVMPLELCSVPPGQIMRKQIPAEKTSEVVDFARLRPPQRLETIRQGLQLLQYGQSEYVRSFGMNVTETPMTVKARILEAPVLKYGEGSRQNTIKPANGQWNMRDKKFFVPKSVKQWVIVVYESDRRFPLNVAQDMATAFRDGASSVGMKIEELHPLIFYENGQGNIGEQLRNAGKACYNAKKVGPDLIVVVLPEGGNQIYTAV